MADPFESSKRRIRRAKQHTAEIKDLAGAFFKSEPYSRVIERNRGGFEEHKIKLTGKIPDEITDLTVEAIEGLRASLDYAICVVGEKVGMTEKTLETLHFPISSCEANFNDLLNDRLRDFPPEIKAFLSGLKPYKTGNVILWALNRVRRQSSHRLIVPVGTAPHGSFIHNIEITRPVPCEVPKLEWDSEKDEVVIVRVGPGSDLKYKIDVTFHIAFGPVEGLAGYELTSTLDELVGQAEGAVAGIEAESRKAGLLR